MKRWFVQIGDKIHGPLDVAEVEQFYTKHRDCLVWGKGMSEWIPHLDWKKSLEVATEKESRSTLWQYRFNDQESKIFKFDDLIEELHSLPTYDNVYVKSDQDPKWQVLYTSQAITEKLGITRRTLSRVPIFGFFEGQNLSQNEEIRAKLLTISEGGCGITEAMGLKIGHLIRGQLISPNLNQNIPVVGEVVYAGMGGEIGIKFSSVTPEIKSLVIEYITKFNEAEPY